MKCPKCNYLGFETGDRCKNCGYDFSLIADQSETRDSSMDVPLHAPAPNLDVPLQASAPTLPAEADLPLFALDNGSDEPLIKVPATPRPPLAVRRTPATPRLRNVPKPTPAREPELQFADPPPLTQLRATETVADVRARTVARLAALASHCDPSESRPRVTAAAIDHILLCGIDLAVLYFTLRMTGLAMYEYAALPPVPLIVFLLLVKLAYFGAFTAVGGQTIGKMLLHIRVVTTDDAPVDPALAAKRALAGTMSAAFLGLGYLPVFLGGERRALHDRLAHTRVIALPSV